MIIFCLHFVYKISHKKSDCPARTNRLKLYKLASCGNLTVARLFGLPASYAGNRGSTPLGVTLFAGRGGIYFLSHLGNLTFSHSFRCGNILSMQAIRSDGGVIINLAPFIGKNLLRHFENCFGVGAVDLGKP